MTREERKRAYFQRCEERHKRRYETFTAERKTVEDWCKAHNIGFRILQGTDNKWEFRRGGNGIGAFILTRGRLWIIADYRHDPTAHWFKCDNVGDLMIGLQYLIGEEANANTTTRTE